MSRYIVLDLEELKKSPYIVIDLSNIGETSPQLSQIRLIREITHSTIPYVVVDLEDIDKQPYIVIDLEDIDKQPYIVIDLEDIDKQPYIVIDLEDIDNKVPSSVQIKLIREVYNDSIPNAIQIKLIRNVENEQSTNINLIRDVNDGLEANSTQINLTRFILNEQSTNIDLIREIVDGNIVFDFSFAGIGQIEEAGSVFDVQCCCITHKNEIIAKITEDKPLYTEKTELTIKPFVFLLIKPINATGISYSDVSDSVSYYEYDVLPLFPDRSNKGYSNRGDNNG